MHIDGQTSNITSESAGIHRWQISNSPDLSLSIPFLPDRALPVTTVSDCAFVDAVIDTLFLGSYKSK